MHWRPDSLGGKRRQGGLGLHHWVHKHIHAWVWLISHAQCLGSPNICPRNYELQCGLVLEVRVVTTAPRYQTQTATPTRMLRHDPGNSECTSTPLFKLNMWAYFSESWFQKCSPPLALNIPKRRNNVVQFYFSYPSTFRNEANFHETFLLIYMRKSGTRTWMS